MKCHQQKGRDKHGSIYYRCASISRDYHFSFCCFKESKKLTKEVAAVEVGDWITVDLKEYQVSGYITSINRTKGFLRMTRTVQHKQEGPVYPTPSLSTYGINQCEIDPFYIAGSDLSTPIDLALSTGDREWFDQLLKLKRLGECQHEQKQQSREAAV